MLFVLLGGIALAVSGDPPLAHGAVVTGATVLGDPREWISPDDYPPAALRIGAAGVTRFRLDIDVNGQVTGCTVTQSSGNADLDVTTCTLLTRRARFTPAQDRQGHALAASYSSAVSWQIPAGAPTPPPCMISPGAMPGDIRVTGVPICR